MGLGGLQIGTQDIQVFPSLSFILNNPVIIIALTLVS